MLPSARTAAYRSFSINFILLAGLLAILWLAGGASRADVLGQPVVRAAAWASMLGAILFGARPSCQGVWPLATFLQGAVLLACAQLIPLPPVIWKELPGRAEFWQIANLTDQSQPWRPLAIVPDAAVNAAGSLIVPVAVLLLVTALTERERSRLPGLLLIMVTASMALGLLQLARVGIGNPLINYSTGEISGNFANRNHFALFIAVGCLIAPPWAFLRGGRPGWRAPVALGLVLLFVLVSLASGSRAGIILGALALVLALVLVRQGIRRELRRRPRWMFPAVVGSIISVIAILVLSSMAADRAISINRIFALDAGQDMRVRGIPTVLMMIEHYFPVGTGFGGFDPVFRRHEPFDLLKPTFFNHAHNDFAEIVLQGGLPALLLLVAALGWWAFISVRVWRISDDPESILRKIGSAILLLILVASVFDYPARTPILMAVIVIAAVWLSNGATRVTSSALRERDQTL